MRDAGLHAQQFRDGDKWAVDSSDLEAGIPHSTLIVGTITRDRDGTWDWQARYYDFVNTNQVGHLLPDGHGRVRAGTFMAAPTTGDRLYLKGRVRNNADADYEGMSITQYATL